MTDMQEKELNLEVARDKAFRRFQRQSYKKHNEMYHDDFVDFLSEDQEWRKAIEEWSKRREWLNEAEVRKELNEEHQSKKEDSMRKRHVPEYMIP